jgi:hypothetical protein
MDWLRLFHDLAKSTILDARSIARQAKQSQGHSALSTDDPASGFSTPACLLLLTHSLSSCSLEGLLMAALPYIQLCLADTLHLTED